MNIFELNVIATPLAGAIGAMTAAKGQSAWTSGVCTLLGLLAGIGIYVGYIGIMTLAGRAAGRNPDGTPNVDRASPVLSLLLIPLIVLPIVTAWGVSYAVYAILK